MEQDQSTTRGHGNRIPGYSVATQGEMMDSSDVNYIRMAVAWSFVAISVPRVWFTIRDCLRIIYGHLAPMSFDHAVTAALLLGLSAFTGGMAWWMIWKRRPSARWWAIAASIMQVAAFAWALVFPPRSIWGYPWGALAVGIIGFSVFITTR